MRRAAKCTTRLQNRWIYFIMTWINPVVKKIQNCRNKWIQQVRQWTETDRQTHCNNYDISAVWETKPRTTPQKASSLLMRPEQVTGPKTLQVKWLWWRRRWWWWWWKCAIACQYWGASSEEGACLSLVTHPSLYRSYAFIYVYERFALGCAVVCTFGNMKNVKYRQGFCQSRHCPAAVP